MPISTDNSLQPIVLIHTQKTAGHSVRMALEDVGYEWKGGVNKHAPPRELNLANHFSFGFVRNPFNVCVSRFFYHQRPEKKNELDLLFKKFSADRNGFISWVHSLVNDDCWYDKKYNWKYTFKTQKNFLSNDDDSEILVDFVGRYEKLHDDFQFVCDKIGCENKLKNFHVNISKRKRNHRDYYDNSTKKIVESIYKDDLEYFNYEF